MSTRWGAWLVAPVLVLAPVTGCGAVADGPVDDAADTAAQRTGSPVSATTVSPETERATTPAPEDSGRAVTQARVVRPAVTVPQLPVGGGGQNGEFEQCVSVRFRGGDDTPLPDGVRITVTGVSLTPPLLELGGAGCSGGETPCLSERFAFTAGNTGSEAGLCFVPVRGTGEWPRGDPAALVLEGVTLTVAGVVECPEGEHTLCEDLAGRLAGDLRAIALEIAVEHTAEASTASPPATASAADRTSSGEATTGSSGAPTEEATPSSGVDAPPD